MVDIKVFIVDDSALVRQVLTDNLNALPGINVIGTASDPVFALKRLESEWPDVIILDIEMPRMDGITFLKKIMQERPTPVIICSSLAGKGAEVTMQAMSSGAVDIITKPTINLKGFLQDSQTLLADAIKAAANARVRKMLSSANQVQSIAPKLSSDAVIPLVNLAAMAETTDRLVAIGTSTGGTQALEYILTRLPSTSPGIVIVQHMPEAFTAAFAERLNNLSAITVKEAEQNDRVIPGLALIAPGGKHMLLKRSGAQYRVEIKDGPLVSRHRPSVDVLFRSTAIAAGQNALGIIMTGMGNDGASGIKELHDTGALTIAQDEASCVVYGMPKEAVKLGAIDAEMPLYALPQLIVNFPNRKQLLKL